MRARKLTEFGVETILSETVFDPLPMNCDWRVCQRVVPKGGLAAVPGTPNRNSGTKNRNEGTFAKTASVATPAEPHGDFFWGGGGQILGGEKLLQKCSEIF